MDSPFPMPAIREATLDDIEAVVSVRMQFLCRDGQPAPQDRMLVEERTREYFRSTMPRREVRVWFMELGGELVSTGAYLLFNRAPLSPLLLKGEAYLFNFYTVPRMRRRGYATALLHEVIAAAQAEGLTRTWLRATEEGEPVYAKMGFRHSDNVMDLRPAPARETLR